MISGSRWRIQLPQHVCGRHSQHPGIHRHIGNRGSRGHRSGWDAVFTDDSDNGVSVDDFLNLMVAQLQNQDFMNPVDDTQYVTQLAQFATMQQMQELATYMKTNYVMSLVGKEVTAARFSVSGELQQETGRVAKDLAGKQRVCGLCQRQEVQPAADHGAGRFGGRNRNFQYQHGSS